MQLILNLPNSKPTNLPGWDLWLTFLQLPMTLIRFKTLVFSSSERSNTILSLKYPLPEAIDQNPRTHLNQWLRCPLIPLRSTCRQRHFYPVFPIVSILRSDRSSATHPVPTDDSDEFRHFNLQDSLSLQDFLSLHSIPQK
jgi:hypothetical protein